MSRVGFETTVSEGERPQTNIIECPATGTRILVVWHSRNKI